MSATVVSIGTTHPWNVAGLGLDQQVAGVYGVRLLCVVAAVSAQDAHGLHAVEPVSQGMLRAQFQALPMEKVAALRVGALVGAPNARIVAEFIAAYPKTPAVVDPVIAATLGGEFLDDEAFAVVREIAALPSVILTPNLDEAARLLGVARVDDVTLAESAARLRERGAAAVLLKGGHLGGDPVDALADAGGVELFVGKRYAAMRGAGCVLAIALACELARGAALHDAVRAAREFTSQRIAARFEFGGLHTAF